MINKKYMYALAVGAVLFAAGNASADLYGDLDLPFQHLTAGESYTGTWTLSGYDPSTQQIDSALASFILWDSSRSGGDESYSVTLGGNAFASGGSFGGLEFILNGITGNALSTLDQTGELEYVVTATSGEFWLKEAGVLAHSSKCDPRNPSPTTIPDGGATLVLLGLGLLGLITAQRRFALAC